MTIWQVDNRGGFGLFRYIKYMATCLWFGVIVVPRV